MLSSGDLASQNVEEACAMNSSGKGRKAQPCRSLGINDAECISDIDSDDCDFDSASKEVFWSTNRDVYKSGPPCKPAVDLFDIEQIEESIDDL